MPQPCRVCLDPQKAKRAAELIASGASDLAIAKELDLGRMSVQRHRTNHVLAPVKALARAADKGREGREQRQQVLAAAESGDPTAWLGVAAIVQDLRKATDRLERAADGAETDNQRLAVASLSGQQLRAAEVRAKLGGVGGYAPQKAREPAEAPMFSVTINLGDGHTETITAVAAEPEPAGPILDHDAGQFSAPPLPVIGFGTG